MNLRTSLAAIITIFSAVLVDSTNAYAGQAITKYPSFLLPQCSTKPFSGDTVEKILDNAVELRVTGPEWHTFRYTKRDANGKANIAKFIKALGPQNKFMELISQPEQRARIQNRRTSSTVVGVYEFTLQDKKTVKIAALNGNNHNFLYWVCGPMQETYIPIVGVVKGADGFLNKMIREPRSFADITRAKEQEYYQQALTHIRTLRRTNQSRTLEAIVGNSTQVELVFPSSTRRSIETSYRSGIQSILHILGPQNSFTAAAYDWNESTFDQNNNSAEPQLIFSTAHAIYKIKLTSSRIELFARFNELEEFFWIGSFTGNDGVYSKPGLLNRVFTALRFHQKPEPVELFLRKMQEIVGFKVDSRGAFRKNS